MVERARNAGIAVVASAGLAVLAGCSGGQPAGGVAGEPVPTTESREWQRTERDYPFLEEAGDTVCNEWTRPGPHGLVEVSRERYSFESMNGALRGKLELAAGARAALVADGVLQVASCEDARAFIRRKREHTATSVLPAKREAVPDMPEEASPESAAPVDKVRESNLYDHFPSVRVGVWISETHWVPCSGILISPWHILTSAHCVSAGSMRISVDYGQDFFPDWCISNNSPNCGVRPTNPNMWVHRHPSYTGNGDTGDDIAIVYHMTFYPWEIIGTDANFFIRLTESDPNVADQFWVQGYGYNTKSGGGLGWGRRSLRQEGIAWETSKDWGSFVTSGYGHPCEGDSGSASINTSKIQDGNGNPLDLATGIASEAELDSGEVCPELGEEFIYTKINPKLDWIAQFLSDVNGTECTKHSSNGTAYRKCFKNNPPPKPPI